MNMYSDHFSYGDGLRVYLDPAGDSKQILFATPVNRGLLPEGESLTELFLQKTLPDSPIQAVVGLISPGLRILVDANLVKLELEAYAAAIATKIYSNKVETIDNLTNAMVAAVGAPDPKTLIELAAHMKERGRKDGRQEMIHEIRDFMNNPEDDQ